MIVHTKKGWLVESKTGKPMGTYHTKKEAVHRLQQIEWFKHHSKKK